MQSRYSLERQLAELALSTNELSLSEIAAQLFELHRQFRFLELEEALEKERHNSEIDLKRQLEARLNALKQETPASAPVSSPTSTPPPASTAKKEEAELLANAQAAIDALEAQQQEMEAAAELAAQQEAAQRAAEEAQARAAREAEAQRIAEAEAEAQRKEEERERAAQLAKEAAAREAKARETEKAAEAQAEAQRKAREVEAAKEASARAVDSKQNKPVKGEGSVAERAQNQGGTSLNDRFARSALKFGLNDRIGFVRDLFDGRQEDFNRVVSQLNSLNSLEEAQQFLAVHVAPDYNWEAHEETAERFLAAVEQRFS